MNQIIESINILLNDFQYFAELSKHINLSNYEFNLLDFFDYPISLQYLSLDIEQVNSSEEAFIALYIKTLYINNGWTDDVIDSNLIHYLENIWIPEDFSRLRDRNTFLIPVSDWEDTKFINEIVYWMIYFKVPSSTIDNFHLNHINSQIIQIGKQHTKKFCFGKTDSTFFLTEFGA